MSNEEKQETMDDIVREMRSKAEHFEKASNLMISESAFALLLYPLIYRIEAAAKREAAIHAMTCEANERLREHLEIALENNKRTFGNAAALREALKKLDDEMTFCERNVELGIGFALEGLREHCRIVRQIINTARSTPPRNCDRLSAEQCKEMFEHEMGIYMTKEATDRDRDIVRRTAYGVIDALFAQSTERKGESDGK